MGTPASCHGTRSFVIRARSRDDGSVGRSQITRGSSEIICGLSEMKRALSLVRGRGSGSTSRRHLAPPGGASKSGGFTLRTTRQGVVVARRVHAREYALASVRTSQTCALSDVRTCRSLHVTRSTGRGTRVENPCYLLRDSHLHRRHKILVLRLQLLRVRRLGGVADDEAVL
jgi:hypothetical protein